MQAGSLAVAIVLGLAASAAIAQSPSDERSPGAAAHPESAETPDFSLALSVPGSTGATPTMTIAAPGDSGSLVATVTPTKGSGFTGFVSLSCSGPPATSGDPGGTSLPVGVSCTFTPLNLEVAGPTTANPTGAVSATMGLETTAAQQTIASRQPQPGQPAGRWPQPALALLLPGIAALGYLGRKRRLLARSALLGLVAVLGLTAATGCSARYRYLNHGPTFTGTLPGTYTLTITAQTSNGVTASSETQPLTLVVK